MQIEPRQLNPPLTELDQASEWARCAASPLYFIGAYGWVLNATEEAWLSFALWQAQAWLLVQVLRGPLAIILKARQLGITWLLLALALWQMLFRPVAVVGIFSRTEDDAIDLLDVRLKGMYARLPAFLRCQAVTVNNKTHWQLSNGSMAMAFPTTGGSQYTFSFVIVDEADHQAALPELLRALKPTTDAGGRMIWLSSANKRTPQSLFKKIYRMAKAGENEWRAFFLPWWARPERTAAWFAAVKRDSEQNTGSLDDTYQEYPASDTVALAPRSSDKRIPATWLQNCYTVIPPVAHPIGKETAWPSIAQLVVYHTPMAGRTYVIGVDPAEGNPTSDDSALCVLSVETGEECATLAGKYQPAVIAAYAAQLADWYNSAGLMVGRNNHGHAVLTWLNDNLKQRQRILKGQDKRPGWVETVLGKVLLYDSLADAFRDGDIAIHNLDTYLQVAGIEGTSLKAPTGEADDRADALALAHKGRAAGSQVSTGGY